jgi:hexosaminidase
MMVDIGRRYMEMDQLERLMRDMAWLKMNTLALHFTDWPAFRLRSEKYPGLADRQSYDRKDIQRLEAYARKHGITIIPEIDLPAHATAIIRYKPSLAFTCPSMRQSEWLTRASPDDTSNMAWTVDITRAENRAWLAGLLDEFIPWFSGPWFHIGGDEYQYDADKTRCPELMDYTRQRGFEHPGDVFVDWINETNRQVKKHGKTTAIWNWWRFRDDKTSIEPDKDILVYVWNRPREKDIIDSGYSVILTPEDRLYVSAGIENFDGSGYGVVDTRFVYEKMPLDRNPKVLGYMVALWTDAAENRTDTYLLGKAHEPMAVLAERLWSDQSSESLNAFLARLNKSSQAPVGELPQPR